jgi:hypothetical protein
MTTRLDLYNKALLVCGERFIAALTEDREPRRLLDHVWNTGGNNYCLEQGQWHFAMRSVMIDYDPTITPAFGLQKAFTKPTDWILTSAVCSDEYFNAPITGYAFEANDWYCDITPIYVKYVSNDAAYGGDLSRWPATFTDYAAAYYASLIIAKLAGDRAAQLLKLFGPPGAPQAGLLHQTLHKAKSAAAFTQPTQFPAQGNWTSSRGGGHGGNDRGNRGSLIG